ncbi:MAG: MFS transporter [Roseibacillus sp.]
MKTRHKFVAATFVLSLILYIDRACISAAKSDITGEFNLSDKQFGWVLSIFAIGYALAQTPAGALSDRLGPRKILTAVVSFWSLFTALTGATFNLLSLLICRFLFGIGEAGAFPGMARATFSWIPVKERGLVTGINFSASRLGGAAAMFAMPALIHLMGWRMTFVVFGLLGFVWAFVWYAWFRDEPSDHKSISEDEKNHIIENRQPPSTSTTALTAGHVLGSRNMWLTMVQYFCSNFTFFFALTWLYPYVKETYDLTPEKAGFAAAIPLLGGFLGNLTSGALVDRLFRSGNLQLSRRIPAIIGFSLAAIGLLASLHMDNVVGAVAFLTLAVFGADMTLSPSWSFCVDIGGKNAGTVSGTMNMAGNVGSVITSLAFPYLTAWFAASTWVGPNAPFSRETEPFFYLAATLNLLAIALWMLMDPRKPLIEES